MSPRPLRGYWARHRRSRTPGACWPRRSSARTRAPSRERAVLRGILMATVLPLAALRAQVPASEAPGDIWPTVARVDSLYFAARLDQALALCDSVFAAGVDNAGLRWRCAR